MLKGHHEYFISQGEPVPEHYNTDANLSLYRDLYEHAINQGYILPFFGQTHLYKADYETYSMEEEQEKNMSEYRDQIRNER